MKLVAFTDLHLDLQTPVSRKDNFFETLMAKLEFVLNYAKTNKAEAVLFSGDFFDKPIQPGTVMHAVITLLRQYEMPLYAVPGQHDVNGHNADDYYIKSLGIIEAAGLLTVLRNGNSVILGNQVCIRGYGFNEPEALEFLEGRDEIPMDELLHVALVHASVGPDECMSWQGISNQNIKSADLTLFGDIHVAPWTHEFDNGCLAIGCGSLARRSISDVGRQPTFLDIEVTDEGFTYKFVEVPSLPDEDLFITREGEDTPEDLAEEFKAEWAKAQLVQDESPIDRVRRVGKLFEHSDVEIGHVIERLPQEGS